MPAAAAKLSQAPENECWPLCGRRVCGIPEYANEPVLGRRARRPSEGTLLRKPAMSGFVMNVIGVEERDEDVDVKERPSAHGSSRSLLTKAIVGFGLPGGRRRRRGTPLRMTGGSVGSNAWRASSESTLPAVAPRFEANSLTAWRMSSSMSKVVRIAISSRIMHQMSTIPGCESQKVPSTPTPSLLPPADSANTSCSAAEPG